MHAVRTAADRYGLENAAQTEVPAADVLAALTQLDEARAALDTLERDLTRAAGRQAGAAGAGGRRAGALVGQPEVVPQGVWVIR